MGVMADTGVVLSGRGSEELNGRRNPVIHSRREILRLRGRKF